MHAIQVQQFGDPNVLMIVELADPVAGPGQVIVKVAAADVLFFDAQRRRGTPSLTAQLPYVPGGGVAGRVASVGPGVDSAWVGQAVAARIDSGGYADHAVVSADTLARVPNGVGLPDAAALVHDGPTALALFDNAAVKPGEHVLITAAGGGLGLLLVQLVSEAGAHVIAAAGSRPKLDAARKAGAEAVVNYSEPDWADRVVESSGGAGVDVTFDGAGGKIGAAAFAATASRGRFSAHGAPSGTFAGPDRDTQKRGVIVRGIEQAQFSPDVAKRLIDQALAAVAAGRFAPVIGQTFPLDRAADAHAAMESRSVVGKTLLIV
jgi:NADPH2:quinone reductase